MSSALAGAAAALAAGREGLRPLPAASLHVTLVFLGTRAEEDVDGIWATASEAVAAGAPPQFAGGSLAGLPRRRPRVFALDLEDIGGGGAALQGAVASALGAEEGRRWRPHVTLVRVGRGAVAVDPGSDPPQIEPFSPPALTLFRSHPHSRYEALRRLELPV